jgi:hypothetical protein
MEYWAKTIPYLAFGGMLLWGLETLQKRARARRRRLTSVSARFGLFVSWITIAVALVLGGLGAVGFYTERGPLNQEVWIIYGGLCAGGFVVWLLGRGIYFVLAGPLPEEPTPSPATADDPPALKVKAANGPSPQAKQRPQEPPSPQDTAASGRATAAARLIMARSNNRDSVNPENRQYYDFILSAAKAVLDDPRLARSIGSKMAPWG